MALVMNASSKEQQVRVHGSWFTFKPDQIKEMNDEKVFFLTSTCAYMGFVPLPESMADLEYRASAEGKDALAKAKAAGIENRIKYLEQLRHNETVSLQQDLDRANLKYDARNEMKPEMLVNLEELAGYKKKANAGNDEKVKKIKELEKLLES